MRKKYLVRSGLLCLVLLSATVALLLSAKPTITSRAAPAGTIHPEAAFYLEVHYGSRPLNSGRFNPPRGSAYLEDAILELLKSYPLRRSLTKEASDLVIECHYRNSVCWPYLGRHWDLHASAVHNVHLRLVDRATDRIVGEAAYDSAPLRQVPKEALEGLLHSVGLTSGSESSLH